MNREHILFECPYAKVLWNEINPMLNAINGSHIYTLKSMIKILERKYKANHIITDINSISINDTDQNNITNITVIEIMSNTMQSILSAWFKYIDLAYAVANAPAHQLTEQTEALNKYTSSYQLQMQSRLYEYLKSSIYALPKHSIRYDLLLIYNTCYDPDKQKEYKIMINKAPAVISYKSLQPKYQSMYLNTWCRSGLAAMTGPKLTLDQRFRYDKNSVQEWLKHDMRLRPP